MKEKVYKKLKLTFSTEEKSIFPQCLPNKVYFHTMLCLKRSNELNEL